MYGQHRMDDVKRIIHAVLTDQIAHFAPRLYVKLTGQTGRGAAQESAQEIADYFKQCFEEYFQVLQVAPREIGRYLARKRVLEYGPGDLPGVALLMVAHGAESATCVDRFPLISTSLKNIEVLRRILDGLQGVAIEDDRQIWRVVSERQILSKTIEDPSPVLAGALERFAEIVYITVNYEE